MSEELELAKRLREFGPLDPKANPPCRAAADAIERLTKERDEAVKAAADFDRQLSRWINGSVHETLQDLLAAADARIKAMEVALMEIEAWGPMTVDDQRWRIARAALTASHSPAQPPAPEE